MEIDTGVRILYWVLLKIRLILPKIPHSQETVVGGTFHLCSATQKWYKDAVVTDTTRLWSLVGCSVATVVCLYRFMLL